MKKMPRFVAALLAASMLASVPVGVGGCHRPASEEPDIVLGVSRHPPAIEWGRGVLSSLPSRDTTTVRSIYDTYPIDVRFRGAFWSGAGPVDLRGFDLRSLDLTGRLDDLLAADFDSGTIWPAELPPGFDPAVVLDLGRNPGLGLRAVHKAGITGAGVGLAIIAGPLLTDHVEYTAHLRHYEEIDCGDAPAGVEGTAAASIAAGVTVGAAPGVDLYYLAVTLGTETEFGFEWDFGPLARAVDRVLEINASLPPGERIRTIAILAGWEPYHKGSFELEGALKRAVRQGLFVVSYNLNRTYGYVLNGLERSPMADPDDVDSYKPAVGPGGWLDPLHPPHPESILVPMSPRTVASPTGPTDYAFYRSGGWNWCVSYLAGLYALACQVDPDVTPAVFWATAARTADRLIGRRITGERGPGLTSFKIVNPARLLAALGGTAGAPPTAPERAGLPADDPLVRRWTYGLFVPDPCLRSVPWPGAGPVDLRGRDLSGLDLSDRLGDLRQADFDEATTWPELLPAAFDPEKVLESGRNPGLGLQSLHQSGLTGRGVGIAVIDEPLPTDHSEYAARLRHYEEVGSPGPTDGAHGAAIASIAAGRTAGVAPEADLYYFAVTVRRRQAGLYAWDLYPVAEALERVLLLNRILPAGERIRVVAIPTAWQPYHSGSTALEYAVQRAARQGVFVVSANLALTDGLAFEGLERDPLSDPEAFSSYRPLPLPNGWAALSEKGYAEALAVPMNSRAVASPTDVDDYVFYRSGARAWCVAYLAGLYALACQVDPDITPSRFWQAAAATGHAPAGPAAGPVFDVVHGTWAWFLAFLNGRWELACQADPEVDAATFWAGLRESGDMDVLTANLIEIPPPVGRYVIVDPVRLLEELGRGGGGS
ncbi:MAG: S8 family serine peptidase [Bacillota bacterium]|jgi:hypothetical protein